MLALLHPPADPRERDLWFPTLREDFTVLAPVMWGLADSHPPHILAIGHELLVCNLKPKLRTLRGDLSLSGWGKTQMTERTGGHPTG